MAKARHAQREVRPELSKWNGDENSSLARKKYRARIVA
jgi:hypothetical protein